MVQDCDHVSSPFGRLILIGALLKDVIIDMYNTSKPTCHQKACFHPHRPPSKSSQLDTQTLYPHRSKQRFSTWTQQRRMQPHLVQDRQHLARERERETEICVRFLIWQVSTSAQNVENHKSLPLAFSEISAWLGTTGGCTSSSVHVDQSIMRSIRSWLSRTWTSSTSAFTRFRPRPCKPLNSTIKEIWKVWDVQIARAPVVSLAAVAVLGLEAPSPWLMPQNTPVMEELKQ